MGEKTGQLKIKRTMNTTLKKLFCFDKFQGKRPVEPGCLLKPIYLNGPA
ncbi:hypothetical protein X474_11345 [Dethiosulfatarculus sandiegensis]|uniref:Uncharacterized protein n=1 Tax=Dethiosulfatarculus sandiegensis TaxID=1429043 RepID=A0A0D2HTN5_9BACT|nr:hypothetical protein X474_11345 [Dethiosulfatarculus sandiegensis]